MTATETPATPDGLTARAPEDPLDLHHGIGLYIHIPFCAAKCTYCDFNTFAGIEPLMPAVVDALETELTLWSTRGDIPEWATVFFGGGTPSYLPATDIQRLIETASANYGIARDAELTLEANPDDISATKLASWQQAGINRLSIGIQSFNDTILRTLSRRHSSHDALNAVQDARQAGFRNISIDLMYGLPNQTLDDWNETLRIAADLNLPHLSLYCLQIERNTPMLVSVQTGQLPTPDDDLAADMYEAAMDALDAAGYEHYEISNWCLPGHRSRHNLGYWKNRPYLGIGPGAHSNLADTRFWNMKPPKQYVEAIRGANNRAAIDTASVSPGTMAVDDVEHTPFETQMAETMMLGMRLREGIRFDEFHRRFGRDVRSVYPAEVRELSEHGLITVDEERVRLTRRGKSLGNEVFQRFV